MVILEEKDLRPFLIISWSLMLGKGILYPKVFGADLQSSASAGNGESTGDIAAADTDFPVALSMQGYIRK